MERIVITPEQRERIIKIICKEFESPCCDNCAHHMGCSGGHKFGPPCLDCQQGISRYKPDHYAEEANNKLFSGIEEVLKAFHTDLARARGERIDRKYRR